MPMIPVIKVHLMQIGDIVKRKRTDLNLTQKDLEESSSVTQSMISKIEGGAADNISIEILRKLAKALHCSVIDLLPESDKNKIH
jgi:transcriptional regulator with XRE-family HTH domain